MSSDKADKGYFWQVLILSLFILFFCAMIATFTKAARGVSRVVDPDYYDHGLNYGRDGEKLRNGERLGWRMAASLSGDLLEIRVSDAKGNPVGGGKVSLTLNDALPRKERKGSNAWAEGSEPAIVEKTPGVYAAVLKNNSGKDVKGKIVFAKGDAALSGRVVVLR